MLYPLHSRHRHDDIGQFKKNVYNEWTGFKIKLISILRLCK